MRGRRRPLADAPARKPRAGGSNPRAYAGYVLGLLTAINLLNYLDRNVLFALFEPIKAELRLSDLQLGWLGSAYIILLSLLSLPLGVLGDLRSRRGVIAWGVGLWSFATALGGLTQRYWQLLLCRAGVGIGEAGYAPASQAIIADYYRGRARAFAIGIYSVGMALGGILGVWIGGVLAERFGWRTAFVVMGIPGLALAVLASRIRELHRRAPASVSATLHRWYASGIPRIVYYAWPAIGVSLLGLVVSWSLERSESVSSDVAAAVFSVFVGAGIAWSIARLVPAAVKRSAHAGQMAVTALEDFGTAAATVLHTPTLIWLFLGGAMVTFAVNGLIAWAATFMTRVHGFNVSEVGSRFGVWALLGGAAGALVGGRLGDWLQDRWAGGRVLASGLGFVLGGPVCVLLILSNDARLLTPLIVATYFFYTWYNGPLAAVILDVVPAAVRSSVLGAFVFFSHIAGDALAPPLVGYLSDRTHDIRAAMLVLPAAGIAGGGVILVALKTIQRDMRRVAA